MAYIKTSDNVNSKLHNLTINSKNQLVGVDDHIVYGFVNDVYDWEVYSKKNGKTEYLNHPKQNVKSMTLTDGIVTVKFNTGRKDLVFAKGKPIKMIQEISHEEPKKDPEPIDVEPLDMIENSEAPESEDIEPIEENEPDIGDSTPEPIPDLVNFQSKLGSGVVLEQDEFEQYQLRDLDKNDFGFIPKPYEIIWFWNRNNIPKYELKPLLRKIQKIDLTENTTIHVTYTDGTQAEYYPKIEPKESKKKDPYPITPPQEEYIISNDPDIPICDGSTTSIEECIRFYYTDELLKECLFKNVLDGHLYLNTKLLGYKHPQTVRYNESWELTTLIQQIEQRFAYTEKNGKLQRQKFKKDAVKDVLVKLGSQNEIDPFYDMIKNVECKGTHNIANFLRDIGVTTRLGDPDEEEQYLQAVSCALFLAIIERHLHREPERPIRFVPILIGDQGVGKSTMCIKLALDQKDVLHKESNVSPDDLKKYWEEISGCVISELAEGVKFTLKRQEAYKSYFGKNILYFRDAYAKVETPHKKYYFDIITTNNNEILTDVTGNTRYYPIFMDGLEKPITPVQNLTVDDMLQYYADALERYELGESWHDYLEKSEIVDIADKIRQGVTQEIKGLDELIQFANMEYSDVGSFMPIPKMKEYLEQNTVYDWDTIESTIRIWGKACIRFGFKKAVGPRDVFVDGKKKSMKGYQRIRAINE